MRLSLSIFLLLEKGPHVTRAGLEHLTLPLARITGGCHHAQLYGADFNKDQEKQHSPETSRPAVVLALA